MGEDPPGAGWVRVADAVPPAGVPPRGSGVADAAAQRCKL